jgi:hypothetical protein
MSTAKTSRSNIVGRTAITISCRHSRPIWFGGTSTVNPPDLAVIRRRAVSAQTVRLNSSALKTVHSGATPLTDYAPRFFAVQCPNEEREANRHLEFLLIKLDDYAQDFQAAIAMFELAERQLVDRLQTSYPWQMRMRWQFIAARDGAMTIFHFGMIMEAIRSSVLLSATRSDTRNYRRHGSRTFGETRQTTPSSTL